MGRDQGALDFAGNATAGNAIYTESGGAVSNSFGGTTSFFNTSTAASATFFLNGGAANSVSVVSTFRWTNWTQRHLIARPQRASIDAAHCAR